MSDAMSPDERAFWRTAASGVSYGVNVKSGVILALLDAVDERDRLAEVESRLSVLLWRLTNGRLSKTTYPVEFMEQEIEECLARYHESDLRDERDADADRVLRLRRLATQPIDTPDGDAILVADVLDILDDKGGPDELDRLRVTVQRVRQACHEGTLAECGDDWESGYTQACSDILAILGADHG